MAAIQTLTALLDSIANVTVAAWLFRLTVLATSACVYLALARRTAPALRHAVALGSLLAVVLLPAASQLMPAVNLPVLSAKTPGAIPGDSPAPMSFEISSGMAPATIHAGARASNPTRAGVATTRPEATTTSALLRRGFALARASFLSARNWIRFAIVMWMLVATAMLSRLAWASARALRTARRAVLITDEFLRVEVERAARALGVTRWIDIAASSEITVPMVIGIATPRIVLPVAARKWSRERMAVVLLHEIAHIRRRDCVSMLFAQVVGAVFWFHPAVVKLARDVRRESERACDDLVLATGVRGSDYAEHLVSIARLSARRDPLAGTALAFAARSTLEQRVFSILAARPRAVDPRTLRIVTAAALAVFTVLAALHPTHAAPAPAALAEPIYSFTFSASAPDQVKEKTHTATDTKKNTRIENRVQNAIRYQLAGTNEDPGDGETWYDRARTYYQRGSFDQAGRAYENAARFGYDSATAFYNAGCSWALAGETDTAIRMLQSAFEQGFDDPDMYATDDDLNSLRGDARFQKLLDAVMHGEKGQQNLRAAQQQFEELASDRQADESRWTDAGVNLMRAGDYDRAVAAFDTAFKLGGDNDALYNQACARSLQGRTAAALDLLEKAISAGSVDVGHMQTDPDLAALHGEKRFRDLAELARELELSDSWQHDMPAWNGNEEERWRNVLPRYESVAAEHRDVGRAWFNLGFVQLQADQPGKSAQSFQKALDLGFRGPTTLYNLACAHARAGNIDTAFNYLAKAEQAGFEVRNSAPVDGDLESLKADPRWKALEQRWQAEEEQKHREKNQKKYD